MENYRDNYYGSILDPLHGDIKLSEIEKWILSQKIFSRLRYVKQNTFLYYVFPSANHTRFEHSIGVMHMAGKIFDSCKENFATGEKKREKYSIKNQSFFDINQLGDKEKIYYQELRLAALLHDVGHGPMSHLFDEFSISIAPFLKIVQGSPVLKNYYDGLEKLVKKEGKVEHEVISCVFVFYLIHELKEACSSDKHKFSKLTEAAIKEISAERIVKMIQPSFAGLLDSLVDSAGNDYTFFFSKIVTAFPIDADRMDYLIRDSYFSGVTYGIYDLNRIYSSFQARCYNSKVDLVYKESGIDSMLRFIQSRSHLYNQVYFHKTNRAVNTMLTYATKSLRSSTGKLLDDRDSLEALIDFYVQNSDEYFVKRNILQRTSGIEKDILQELIDRKLFKRVYEKKVVIKGGSDEVAEQKKALGEIKSSIERKLNSLLKSDIVAEVDFYENKTFKDAGDKNVALARKKPGEAYTFSNDWKNAGKEFDLSDMVVCMLRAYLRRTFHSSKQFEEMSETVRTSITNEIKQLDAYSG